jgi:hypothetical protein
MEAFTAANRPDEALQFNISVWPIFWLIYSFICTIETYYRTQRTVLHGFNYPEPFK